MRPKKICIYFWLVATIALASGQTNCPLVELSDLGSNSTYVDTGLLFDALNASKGTASNVSVLEFNTVCLAQGSRRDMYRSISIVVRYHEVTGTEYSVQIQYQCTNGRWSADNFNHSGSLISDLTTTLRMDCLQCREAANSSPTEHCIGSHS